MRTLKLTLTYDGTRFVGWQRQAEGVSVQGLLEDALGVLEGTAVTAHGAGRTDAGVHALGQVASVTLASTLDLATIGRALNARLPADLRVLDVAEAPADFHARFSSVGKTYRYQIAAGPLVSPFASRWAWHLPQPLDLDAMATAATALLGTHDFAAFQSTGTPVASSVRTLTASTVRTGHAELPAGARHPLVVYEVTGDGFLRHMVRAIAGTLVEIGRGWRSPDSVPALLAGRARAAAGVTAPSQGLFLVRVDY